MGDRLASWLGSYRSFRLMQKPYPKVRPLDREDPVVQAARDAERVPEKFAEAWYRMEQMPHYEATWTSLLPAVLSLRGANPEAAFSPADLEAIRSPVLLIWGSDDPFGGIEKGRAGASHFREAEFRDVGTGHLPWLDEPERCGELLRAFLDRRSDLAD